MKIQTPVTVEITCRNFLTIRDADDRAILEYTEPVDDTIGPDALEIAKTVAKLINKYL